MPRKPIEVHLTACDRKQVLAKDHVGLAKNLCQKVSVPTWNVTNNDATVDVTWVTERDKKTRAPTSTQPGGSLRSGSNTSETKCFCGVEDVILHLNSRGKDDTATALVDVCSDSECAGGGEKFEECKKKEK